jgi:hypothetical protein
MTRVRAVVITTVRGYPSAIAPTFPLGIDTSLNSVGSTIQWISLSDAADACPMAAITVLGSPADL